MIVKTIFEFENFSRDEKLVSIYVEDSLGQIRKAGSFDPKDFMYELNQASHAIMLRDDSQSMTVEFESKEYDKASAQPINEKSYVETDFLPEGD